VILTAAVVAALLSVPCFATAHEKTQVGKIILGVGWIQEPAYAGLPNAVDVSVRVGGEPVEDAVLTAVVVFGDPNSTSRTEELPLDPVPAAPGDYHAFVIPTRPGTYTFEISGKVGAKRIDESFTSGEQSFEDVVSPAEAQFPEQDPTQGELAGRLERIDARIADLRARVVALGEEDGSSVPMLLGIAGVLLGGIALAIAISGRRHRRA
jgi:hypothetical protein